jgi:hypothetical protein
MINFKKFHNSYSKVKILSTQQNIYNKTNQFAVHNYKKLHMCSPASTLVRVRENTYVINT